MSNVWPVRLPLCVSILLSLAALPSGRALIFSQLGKTYDPNQNRIAWSNAWNRGHIIGSLHGATGIAIAPYWFLTAAHLERSKPRVFDTLGGSFIIQEFVPLKVNDMMLCRVDRPFLRYSALLNESTRTGQVVRVYGQSSAHWAKSPIFDSDGKVKGWTMGAEYQPSMGLREGLGRLQNASIWGMSWPFSAYDPEVGTNAAAAVHMDSGGGVFLGEALVGILTQASSPNQVRPTNGLKGKDCFVGYIFDVTNMFECNLDKPTHPYHYTATPANAVAVNLEQIYQVIAPPVRIDLGTTTAGTNRWEGWSGSYRTFTQPAAEITAQSSNDVPALIYRTSVISEGSKQLSYFATNLLTTELYTVRLHFGSSPKLRPGDALQDLYINGVLHASAFDPIAAGEKTNGRALQEIKNIRPEYGNRVSITLVPGGAKKTAYLSGLEIIRQPGRL